MSRSVTPGALAAAVLVLAAVVSGCGGTSRPDTSAHQKLHWSACPAPDTSEDPTATSPPGRQWQCATMHAPLNYRRPHGRTVDIALIRERATKPAHRIGSLVFNFGGPGGSGVASLPSFASDYKKLRTRYDLVSFDPRGVGRSDGVHCLGDRAMDRYFAADATPDTGPETRGLLKRTRDYAAACRKRSGSVLPYVGTTNAARDLDLLRRVLGDRRLHYFGISYGTELGGVYAHLFPHRVGRAVFDGVVDPTQDPEQSALGQAEGFQRALDDYLRACRAGHVGGSSTSTESSSAAGTTASCPTSGQITGLLRKLDHHPLRGAGGRKLTQTLADDGIAQSLYSKDFWQYLTQGLSEARQGEGRILLALADSLNGRAPDGRYSTLQPSLTAITCADFRQRYPVRDIRAKLPAFRRASPVFGASMAWGLTQCTDWPVRGTWRTPDVHAKGSAPIVVVGNTGDPATPYEGSRRMVQQLGKGVGVQLTYHGEGHGAYDSHNTCVRDTVNGYLLHGRVPPAGKVCR